MQQQRPSTERADALPVANEASQTSGVPVGDRKSAAPKVSQTLDINALDEKVDAREDNQATHFKELKKAISNYFAECLTDRAEQKDEDYAKVLSFYEELQKCHDLTSLRQHIAAYRAIHRNFIFGEFPSWISYIVTAAFSLLNAEDEELTRVLIHTMVQRDFKTLDEESFSRKKWFTLAILVALYRNLNIKEGLSELENIRIKTALDKEIEQSALKHTGMFLTLISFERIKEDLYALAIRNVEFYLKSYGETFDYLKNKTFRQMTGFELMQTEDHVMNERVRVKVYQYFAQKLLSSFVKAKLNQLEQDFFANILEEFSELFKAQWQKYYTESTLKTLILSTLEQCIIGNLFQNAFILELSNKIQEAMNNASKTKLPSVSEKESSAAKEAKLPSSDSRSSAGSDAGIGLKRKRSGSELSALGHFAYSESESGKEKDQDKVAESNPKKAKLSPVIRTRQ